MGVISFYLAIELSLKEISYVLYALVRALMTQNSYAVEMRNAKLGNHLNHRLNCEKVATSFVDCRVNRQLKSLPIMIFSMASKSFFTKVFNSEREKATYSLSIIHSHYSLSKTLRMRRLPFASVTFC